MTSDQEIRQQSFGEGRDTTLIDRFGIFLSRRSVLRTLGNTNAMQIGDFGCGYDATLSRELAKLGAYVTVVDVSLSETLKTLEQITAFEGPIPETLSKIESASLDAVLLISVLEHLWTPTETLGEIRRVLKPGGQTIINVPSWRGKRFLEFSAFKLGFSPKAEMDDHKRYYDPRDLWLELVAAGFAPSGIHIRRHKFGLNTVAVCTAFEK